MSPPPRTPPSPRTRSVTHCRGVGTGGATGARAPPIFCALALAAASHVRTTRNATGDLYLRRHNCPKCPQNAPKICLKSQILWGGMPDPPRLAALWPILAPPVIFIFLRPWLGSAITPRASCLPWTGFRSYQGCQSAKLLSPKK